MVMQKCPTAANICYSPVLKKIYQSVESTAGIIDYLLEQVNKKDLHDEIRILLLTNLEYFTPSTVWLLKTKSFKFHKLQQMVRLKATFTVHDCFLNNLDNMINFSTLIKSPTDLADVWLKAVIRTKAPLSYKQVKERYWDALQ